MTRAWSAKRKAGARFARLRGRRRRTSSSGTAYPRVPLAVVCGECIPRGRRFRHRSAARKTRGAGPPAKRAAGTNLTTSSPGRNFPTRQERREPARSPLGPPKPHLGCRWTTVSVRIEQKKLGGERCARVCALAGSIPAGDDDELRTAAARPTSPEPTPARRAHFPRSPLATTDLESRPCPNRLS